MDPAKASPGKRGLDFQGVSSGNGSLFLPRSRGGLHIPDLVPKGKGQTETQVQAQVMGRRQDSSRERKGVMGFSDLSPVPTTNMRGVIRNRAPSLTAALTRMGWGWAASLAGGLGQSSRAPETQKDIHSDVLCLSEWGTCWRSLQGTSAPRHQSKRHFQPHFLWGRTNIQPLALDQRRAALSVASDGGIWLKPGKNDLHSNPGLVKCDSPHEPRAKMLSFHPNKVSVSWLWPGSGGQARAPMALVQFPRGALGMRASSPVWSLSEKFWNDWEGCWKFGQVSLRYSCHR